MASIFSKSELTGTWKERFQDVKKLNEYMDNNPGSNIENSYIKEYDLTNAKFSNTTFSNVEWNETTGKNISFSNSTFRSNVFNRIEFTDTTLTNVIFEDSEFNGSIFYDNTFTNVKFINCKFKFKPAFLGLKNSNLEFERANFEEGSFSESHASLIFRDSTLNNVRLVDLVFPSSLTFENSKLNDIALDRSKLSKLVMDNVTGGGDSGFNGGSVAEIDVRNSTMGFSLNEGTLGNISFVNSVLEGGFINSEIKHLDIKNCKGMKGLGLYEAKIESMEINNCPVHNIVLANAIIQNAIFDKSTIEKGDFRKLKVKNLTFTDVSFNHKVDFTGAQVEHLITKNVTKLPGLNLNLTGSNVKF